MSASQGCKSYRQTTSMSLEQKILTWDTWRGKRLLVTINCLFSKAIICAGLTQLSLSLGASYWSSSVLYRSPLWSLVYSTRSNWVVIVQTQRTSCTKRSISWQLDLTAWLISLLQLLVVSSQWLCSSQQFMASGENSSRQPASTTLRPSPQASLPEFLQLLEPLAKSISTRLSSLAVLEA